METPLALDEIFRSANASHDPSVGHRVLACMNVCFYLAISRLPLATVGAIEFLGPIAIAAFGTRTRRNALALFFAITGISLMTHLRLGGELWGYTFAFSNCLLFSGYVLLGHRAAAEGGKAGIERLSAAMLVALFVVTPATVSQVGAAVLQPRLLLAGVGVGICSSVIPYICDQLAMAQLSQGTFALLFSILPATASLIGICVLHQIPSVADSAGIGLVVASVLLRQESPRAAVSHWVPARLLSTLSNQIFWWQWAISGSLVPMAWAICT